MKLETVIHTILQTKNFITIPGLGSFVSQYQPARIIQSDYVKFLPPQKILAFNTLLQHDDGVLVSVLEHEYKLTKEQARKEVDTFVNTTKDILQTTNIVNLQGIGTLYYNHHAIEFEPANQKVSTQAYGLTDFSVHILPQESRLKEYVEKKKTNLPLHKKIIKTTFILSPVIFGALLIPNIIHAPHMTSIISLFRDTDAYVDFSIPRKPIPVLEYKKTEPIESYQHQQTASNQSTIEHATQEKNTIQAATQIKQTKQLHVQTNMPIEQRVQYYIIVGSYSSEKNAKIQVSKLKDTFSNAGIIKKDGKIRVYVETAFSKEVVKQSLETIQKQEPYKAAWIYTQKV